MTYITPAELLDPEVKEIFYKEADTSYTKYPEYFERCDSWFDGVALKLGVLPEDYPAPMTNESIELMECWVNKSVCKRRIGKNVTSIANNQKSDMWKDKFDQYNDDLDDLLSKFDKTDLVGYTPEEGVVTAAETNVIRMRRA